MAGDRVSQPAGENCSVSVPTIRCRSECGRLVLVNDGRPGWSPNRLELCQFCFAYLRVGHLLKCYTMKTVKDNLDEISKKLQALLAELLLRHSVIYQWNRYDPDSGMVIIPIHGNFGYKPLNEQGRQVQARLLEEYRHYFEVIRSLLREQAQDTLQTLTETDTVLVRTIEQQETACETTQEAFDNAVQALGSQLGLLERLYDASNGRPSYIPDTNALLYNPKLETWSFDESPRFDLVLLPTVLSELDAHKISHRNEAVREKSDKLIRQIKEYRRRGKLTEGVNLVADTIGIMAVATEPRAESFLHWFDPTNNDDRILASVLEVMRQRPRSPVVLVSRDVNLQNKAEFARIPFVEPPEPA